MREVFAHTGRRERAARTFADDVDVFRQQPGSQKLAAVGLPEVEVVVGEELGGVGEATVEGVAHLLPDPVAARSNRRPDGGVELMRLAGEILLHTSDALFGHGGCCAAPAGMQHSHSTVFRIEEHDGDAVCRLDAEENARPAGSETVAFEDGATVGTAERRSEVADGVDGGGMNLTETDGSVAGLAGNGQQEAAAVLRDVRRIILFGPAKIERGLARRLAVDGRDTARASAEAVTKPAVVLPGRNLNEIDDQPAVPSALVCRRRSEWLLPHEVQP